MTENIASVVLGALGSFELLSEIIHESDETPLRGFLHLKLNDELARLKVWTGNSGAHQTGRASLEHRLRDASHIRHQVLNLLRDLTDSLRDATDIVTGRITPWEETEDDEEPFDHLETETEMEQIVLDITELVDCLMRLSVSIQNPAPHDRFMLSTFTDTSAFEDVDIRHVQAKFPDMEEYLAQRLGRAISRRRQYFKYREAHYQKLSYGLDRHGDTNKTEPSTLASSIPPHMKQEISMDISGGDAQSDGRASVTSFATSVSGSKTLKVPQMPEDALKGPFMCPFCHLIISAQDTMAWKKHVFGDLRPYNCVARHCTASDREFSRRREWMQHMLQDHLRVYRCPCHCPDSFLSAAESRNHLVRTHSGEFSESKVDSIVELSSQPLAHDAHTDCPFCPEKLMSLKQYRRHVGNHQQDLALFALPRTEDGEDDISVSGHESDDISMGASDGEPINATAQNREAVSNANDEETIVRQASAAHQEFRERTESEAGLYTASFTRELVPRRRIANFLGKIGNYFGNPKKDPFGSGDYKSGEWPRIPGEAHRNSQMAEHDDRYSIMEAPSREGSSREGSSREGSSREGSSREGSSREGSSTEGPSTEGISFEPRSSLRRATLEVPPSAHHRY